MKQCSLLRGDMSEHGLCATHDTPVVSTHGSGRWMPCYTQATWFSCNTHYDHVLATWQRVT